MINSNYNQDERFNQTEINRSGGDPIWISTCLSIFNIVAGSASITSLILMLISKDTRNDDLKKYMDHVDKLRFLFVKHRETTRRLFALLDESLDGFAEKSLLVRDMSFKIDKYHYPIYRDIKRDLARIRDSVEELLDQIEQIAVEYNVDTSSSKSATKLMDIIDSILMGWGKVSCKDLVTNLKKFNHQLDLELRQLTEHFEVRKRQTGDGKNKLGKREN